MAVEEVAVVAVVAPVVWTCRYFQHLVKRTETIFTPDNIQNRETNKPPQFLINNLTFFQSKIGYLLERTARYTYIPGSCTPYPATLPTPMRAQVIEPVMGKSVFDRTAGQAHYFWG